ncbi:MAG: hypothetical protein RBS40_09535 [Rhodocyclaceae bacterium]|nr:hypothetical protein [Rhodocyclaceae bacterium]
MTDFATPGEIGPPPVSHAYQKAHRNAAYRQQGSIRRFDEHGARMPVYTAIKS